MESVRTFAILLQKKIWISGTVNWNPIWDVFGMNFLWDVFNGNVWIGENWRKWSGTKVVELFLVFSDFYRIFVRFLLNVMQILQIVQIRENLFLVRIGGGMTIYVN